MTGQNFIPLTDFNFNTVASDKTLTVPKLTTARTIKIGRTSRSFDGSANITWNGFDTGLVPEQTLVGSYANTATTSIAAQTWTEIYRKTDILVDGGVYIGYVQGDIFNTSTITIGRLVFQSEDGNTNAFFDYVPMRTHAASNSNTVRNIGMASVPWGANLKYNKLIIQVWSQVANTLKASTLYWKVARIGGNTGYVSQTGVLQG